MAAEPAEAGLRRRSERHGRRAEWIAALFLRLKGYRVLARRYRTPVGEVDLILRRGGTIAFVEVKARADAADGLAAVTPAGRQRIVRAAQHWLGRHPDAAAMTLRFDVVTAAPRRLPRHFANAFDAAGTPT